MSTLETFQLPVTVDGWGGSLVDAQVPGKSGLRLTAPLELGGEEGAYWSPEELLVNAVASSYSLTLLGFARRLRVPLGALSVRGLGHVEKQSDGAYGFVLVELEVGLTTDAGLEPLAERAAALAEDAFLVGRALEIPVRVRVEVARKPVESSQAA